MKDFDPWNPFAEVFTLFRSATALAMIVLIPIYAILWISGKILRLILWVPAAIFFRTSSDSPSSEPEDTSRVGRSLVKDE